MFRWDMATVEFIKQLVEQIPIYIADVNPSFWDVAFPVPLSSPFDSEIPPFSQPMGSRDVIRLIREASTFRLSEGDYQSLAMDIKHPRLGPGKINGTASHLQVANHGRLISVDITIQGTWLGRDDRLLVVPASVSCPPVDWSGASLKKDATELVKAESRTNI